MNNRSYMQYYYKTLQIALQTLHIRHKYNYDQHFTGLALLLGSQAVQCMRVVHIFDGQGAFLYSKVGYFVFVGRALPWHKLSSKYGESQCYNYAFQGVTRCYIGVTHVFILDKHKNVSKTLTERHRGTFIVLFQWCYKIAIMVLRCSYVVKLQNVVFYVVTYYIITQIKLSKTL